MKWEILNKSLVASDESLFKILLENRGIKSKKDKEEFLNPKDPMNIRLDDLKINTQQVKKIKERVKIAKKKNEFVIISGDYDADGITATAILWESLHGIGLEILPFIPDRFEDGYGIKTETVLKIKEKFPKVSLIITIDNGIVAYEGINKARELGIDVIVIDHHQKGVKKLKTSFIIHNTSVCGSALAWLFSKELSGKLETEERLGLAAIGTVADQMPLVGINRSIVKFGLHSLENTRRPGLIELFRESGLKQGINPCSIGTYEINYIIAPRINAMGRLKNGIESLRLLCTKNRLKAIQIAENVGRTNKERQKIVDEVLSLARTKVTNEKIIVVAGENYHEGVIGLAAGKLTEEYHRPSIVFSIDEEIAKASARSISGFNIIEAIRKVNLHLEGGGHPMAAGFSIKSSKIEDFIKQINKHAKDLLTEDLLQKKVKIDCELNFGLLNDDLIKGITKLEPFGLGNPHPIFITKKAEVCNARTIGRDSKHLKLKLKKDEYIFDAIYFDGGEMYSKLTIGSKIDLVYGVDENIWNGYKNIQLIIKDILV